MARTSSNSISKAITPSNVYSLLKNKVFNIFRIRVSKTGSIKIEIEPAKKQLNYTSRGVSCYYTKPVEYTIGYGNGIGYWLRRQGESGSTFPLHYDRNTGKYGFKTFEEAVAYLEKLFAKKYINTIKL